MSALGSAGHLEFFAFAHEGALPGRGVLPDAGARPGNATLPRSTTPRNVNAVMIPKKPLLFLKFFLLFWCFCRRSPSRWQGLLVPTRDGLVSSSRWTTRK